MFNIYLLVDIFFQWFNLFPCHYAWKQSTGCVYFRLRRFLLISSNSDLNLDMSHFRYLRGQNNSPTFHELLTRARKWFLQIIKPDFITSLFWFTYITANELAVTLNFLEVAISQWDRSKQKKWSRLVDHVSWSPGREVCVYNKPLNELSFSRKQRRTVYDLKTWPPPVDWNRSSLNSMEKLN